MAYSRITLYNANISKDKNMIVESIASYLSSVTEKQELSENHQFMKPALDTSINLNMTQFEITPYNVYDFRFNYMKVVNKDVDSTLFPLYYFIESIKWVSSNTIKVFLHLDVLNTFCSSWYEPNVLDRQTRIRRSTATKYSKDTLNNKLKFLIPYLCDEINPIKYKKDNYVLDESTLPSNATWYLIYKSRVSTEDLETRPVDCFVTSNKNTIKIRMSANSSISYATMPGDFLWILGKENQNLKTNVAFFDKNGIRRTICFKSGLLDDIKKQAILIERLTSPNRLRVSLYCWSSATGFNLPYYVRYSPFSDSYETGGDSNDVINLLNVFNVTKGRYNSTNDFSESTITGWNAYTPTSSDVDCPLIPIQDLDRTDTSLIKVIELPYCPVTLTAVATLTYTCSEGFYDQSTGMIRLYDTTNKLERTLECFPSDAYNINSRLSTVLNTFVTTYPNNTLIDSHWDDIDLEPMLKHSNYYSCKYVYDTFEKDVQLEEIDGNMAYSYVSKFNLKFYATSTINSRFMFDVSGNGYTYKYSKEIYQDYMFIQRNNELPLYSDSYINYIRSGYNYDQKNRFYRNIEAGFNAIYGAGKGFVGDLESKGVAGAAVSTAWGLIKSGVDIYFKNIQELRNLEEKQVALKLQTETFSGADDLDLMNVYAGNKLRFMSFTPNEIMTKALHQLYFYTGYPQNYFANSLPHSNRYWFDFVQADIVFLKSYAISLSNEMQNEIIQKYSVGVTYFHRRNDSYDLEQKYVNHDHNLI